MVSPVKKLGSPPPHGIVIRVGTFDENLAHHAYRADRCGVQLQADEHLIAAGRKGDGPVHYAGLVLADRHGERLHIRSANTVEDLKTGLGSMRVGYGVHVVRAGRRNLRADQQILRIVVSRGGAGRTHPVAVVHHDRAFDLHVVVRHGFYGAGDVRVGEPVNPLHAHAPYQYCRAHPAGSVSWPQ